MKHAGFYRKVLKLSTFFERKLKNMYIHALANGKESFTIKLNTQLEYEVVGKLCDRLHYEKSDFAGFKYLIQTSKEDRRFRDALFKHIHPSLIEVAINGQNYTIVDENKFSIVYAEPILNCLGFKCRECGNEIWAIDF